MAVRYSMDFERWLADLEALVVRAGAFRVATQVMSREWPRVSEADLSLVQNVATNRGRVAAALDGLNEAVPEFTSVATGLHSTSH